MTELGLRFHLVTRYTSFVAVDESRVIASGLRAVVRPSPLPARASQGGGGNLDPITIDSAELNSISLGDIFPTVVGSTGLIMQVGDQCFCSHADPCETWEVHPTPVTEDLLDIDSYRAELVVGAVGTILRRQESGDWVELTSGTTEDLRGVTSYPSTAFSALTHAWAVGDGGTILRFEEATGRWVEQDSGTTENLRAVHATSPEDVWVVGESGTILRWTE